MNVKSTILLSWNEIPCLIGKKKQKRKEEQRADKNVCSMANWNAVVKFVHVNTINKVHVTKILKDDTFC